MPGFATVGRTRLFGIESSDEQSCEVVSKAAGGDGITANAVLPGTILSPKLKPLFDK